MSRITTVKDKIPKKASWPGFLASGKDSRTKVVLARKLEKQGLGSTPAQKDFYESLIASCVTNHHFREAWTCHCGLIYKGSPNILGPPSPSYSGLFCFTNMGRLPPSPLTVNCHRWGFPSLPKRAPAQCSLCDPDIQLTIVSKKACIICMMPYQEQLTNGQCQRTEAAQRPGSGTSRGGRRAPPSPASAPPATLYQNF